jgi:hypothetical protein
MPVHVYWEDETQTISRWEFEGSWTAEEFYEEFRSWRKLSL